VAGEQQNMSHDILQFSFNYSIRQFVTDSTVTAKLVSVQRRPSSA